MVEISNARYEELIKAETRFNIVKALAKTVPSWKWEESLRTLLIDESEVKPDAE